MPFQTRQRLQWAGCVLVGVCMLANPATSQTPDPLTLQAQLEQVQKLQQATAEELKAQNKELQERLKAQETALLETQRKSIDWWLTAIGILLTGAGLVFALLGILIPLYWQRSERQRLKAAQAEFERMNQEAQEALSRLDGHAKTGAHVLEDAKTHASKIGQLRSQAEGFAAGKHNQDSQGSSQRTETNALAIQAATQLQNDPAASDLDRLRARAIQASQVSPTTAAQALKAFDLWKAVTLIAPQDASAHFNAGYWAQQLYKMDARPGKTHWLEMLVFFYEQALWIKPDKYEAAYNWGTALGKEAKALAEQDLPAAREMWRRAGEKYAQALQIKPDKHVAFYNWGAALSAEAKAINQQNPSEARGLWGHAVEKYKQSLQIERVKNKAIYNLACVYSLQGRAADAVAQLEAARQADELPDQWRTDPDLNPIRTSAEYQAWVAQLFPNPIPTDTNASKGT